MLSSFASSRTLSSGRQLALPLPLMLLLTGPIAHAQAPEALSEVGLYPNPAHIRATVEVPAVPGATRASVRLLDAQGTVVFEQPVSLLETGGTTELPLLGRAPGLYRVQVQVGELRVARTLKVE
ncbi:T9SS type A sorting domain-containing protein [Hymenobacter sp. BT523]|uniref:T9SS type A sorting domain-containing protein n=1 Tax=Hymenobacter sp. BT523 TaxID=2795725 RepID=UPI0018ECC1CE|nr:T9SS type A sorting domain-containing protein [Hymenobacter sp. BT523]MBJ6107800.1 T9SS type A sorting domain-containing protein [Hymenobacter sp. BT523]